MRVVIVLFLLASASAGFAYQIDQLTISPIVSADIRLISEPAAGPLDAGGGLGALYAVAPEAAARTIHLLDAGGPLRIAGMLTFAPQDAQVVIAAGVLVVLLVIVLLWRRRKQRKASD